MLLELIVVDPGWCHIDGWNRVWNRALPWFATQTHEERCFAADYRVTAVTGGAVVGIAQVRRTGDSAQLTVAVDPEWRGQGIGSALAAEVAARAYGAAFVFEHDPADAAGYRLAERHGLQPGAPSLALWSLDPLSLPSSADADASIGAWTEDRPGDLDALAEAVRWWATDNQIDEAGIADWQRSLSQQANPWTTIARDSNGDIVGVAWAEPIPHTDYARATHLAVKPDHRGRGVGLALKTAQARHAAAAGSQLLVTQIAPNNRANQIWAAAHATRHDLVGFSRPE